VSNQRTLVGPLPEFSKQSTTGTFLETTGSFIKYISPFRAHFTLAVPSDGPVLDFFVVDAGIHNDIADVDPHTSNVGSIIILIAFVARLATPFKDF
jgi:hypothetical protein